jgi:dolichol-phosphate mannosyltransferase
VTDNIGALAKKLISICTPAYNESACVDELARRLADVFEALSERYEFEVIVCENGSSDDTYAKLLAINERDARFKVVRLARNFFTEGGYTAALSYARGDAAVIMNSDLQDPPEYIPEMIGWWEKGYKNVYAVVSLRSGESAFRRFFANAFYALASLLSESPIPRNVSDFRLVDRVAYRTYLAMRERYRIVRFIWPWMGFSSIGIDTERPLRGGGRSTFRFFWMLHAGVRWILSQTRTPLVVIPIFGLGLAGLSFALFVFESVRAVVRGVPFDGYGTIVGLMLMLFGFLFLFLWMVAEYVGMIFEEVRHRPNFIVEETRGLDGVSPGPENLAR